MARQHFGCSTLQYLFLENDGGSGTASGHWEKKFFGNELMTGQMSGYPIMSNITLAVMEDSGWYKVNYDTAQNFTWGKGYGCSFFGSSCSGFKEFCTKDKQFVCDKSYMFKGFC